MRGKAINSEARDILNSVTKRLTTEALKEMNARNVGDEKKEPRALATEFVQQK